jgi:hypothetical protein
MLFKGNTASHAQCYAVRSNGSCSLLAISSESSMRTFNSLVLLILFVMPSASTQAADLNGAWTIDASACGQMFTKENNKLAFKQDADLHAGGLIIQGKQITGTLQKCTVKSSHDDGSNVRVIASCSDGIALSDVAFDVKISGENRITLNSNGPVPVEMSYVRCPM